MEAQRAEKCLQICSEEERSKECWCYIGVLGSCIQETFIYNIVVGTDGRKLFLNKLIVITSRLRRRVQLCSMNRSCITFFHPRRPVMAIVRSRVERPDNRDQRSFILVTRP